MLTPRALFVLATGIATCGSPAVSAQSSPDTIVLPLLERGEGAPSRVGSGLTVILTDQRASSPYHDAVDVLVESGYTEIVRVVPWDAQKAFDKLQRIAPGAVIAVFPPDKLTVNFHYDILERASRLDDDPFTDFVFGYITGGTPEAAADFTRSALKASRGGLTKEVLEFGPSSQPSPATASQDHPWASGFRTRRWDHADNAELVETLAKLGPRGILSAWGNGLPEGVDRGIHGRLFKKTSLDLSSCIVLSAPSYAGLPTTWFDASSGRVERFRMEPQESLALGFISVRAAGVFGSLDVGRDEFNHHELENLLLGASLGAASKATYDDVVMAQGKQELRLRRYVQGETKPHRNATEEAIAAGAARVLYGIPTWTPFEAESPSPFEVVAEKNRGAIEITWVANEFVERYWLPRDVLRGNGGWTHRLRFRVAIPLRDARRLDRMEVVELTRDGKSLPYSRATAAIELAGGEAILHVNVTYRPNPDDRALANGRRYEATLRIM